MAVDLSRFQEMSLEDEDLDDLDWGSDDEDFQLPSTPAPTPASISKPKASENKPPANKPSYSGMKTISLDAFFAATGKPAAVAQPGASSMKTISPMDLQKMLSHSSSAENTTTKPGAKGASKPTLDDLDGFGDDDDVTFDKSALAKDVDLKDDPFFDADDAATPPRTGTPKRGNSPSPPKPASQSAEKKLKKKKKKKSRKSRDLTA